MKVFVKILFIVIMFTSCLLAQVFSPYQLRSKNTETPTKFNYVPKKPGHYTAQDWATVIDTTWGEGLPTDQKLALFSKAWNFLDDNYAAFQNFDVDWQAVYDLYYDEINAGVSHGRFVAIMNHMALALQECHTWIWNKEVNDTPLEPGLPLFLPCANGENTSRFGATLTPLPDSSLLVIKAKANHPLGLVPGDLVLGYDGIPWKVLYKELLAAQLPIYFGWVFPASDSATLTHLFLVSAGINWHLFDTLDVLKYGTTDTMHYATSALAGQDDFIWGNEQLPIPGVPWPYEGTENPAIITEFSDLVSWGIVDGTNIGYIYALAWTADWYWPGFNIANQFYNAIDSLMNIHHVDGLIIDQRLNYGGQFQFQKGFSLLFNHRFFALGLDKRSDPNNHFAMLPYHYWDGILITNGDPKTFYDRPIAVLTGPATPSAGDVCVFTLKMHPMSRLFGKPTSGAFSTFWSYTLGYSNWEMWYTETNEYPFDEPGNYLAHKGLKPDEDVWFTQEDVAKGEDTVVKRAIEWIQNLAYAHDVTVNKSYVTPVIDSVIVKAQVENPNEHELSLTAVIRNPDSTITDSINLFDDGQHGDSAANDNIWGNFYVPSEEQLFKVSVTTGDNYEETSRTLPNVAWFTSIGRLVVDSCDIISSDTIPNHGDRIDYKLTLKNEGQTATATNVTTNLVSLDSCATISGFSDRPYGDIAPGATAIQSGRHSIIFSDTLSGCSNPMTNQILVEISSDGVVFWYDTLEIVVTDIKEATLKLPKTFALYQNYPNPFNPSTTIEYDLPKSSDVKIEVYNIAGQKIRTLLNKKMPAGNHEIEFNGQNLSSGVYFYRIEAGEFQDVKKMILIK